MASERERIEALIPHRPPFLFVDRIVEAGADRIVTEWRVDPEMECFRGHYPGEPVLPGVLITESCLQSAALLIAGATARDSSPGVPVVTKIEEARFRQLVRPGDVLGIEVGVDERLGAAWYCTGKVTRAGRAVARAKFVLTTAGESE